MTIKPFLVDGNIVVNEATITNSGTSIVLPTNSHFSGGGNILVLHAGTVSGAGNVTATKGNPTEGGDGGNGSVLVDQIVR